MTIYAGEVVRIKSSAKGYDDTVLTASDITSATIQIFDANNAIVRATAPMTYNATLQYWFFDWNTTGIPAGAYKAKVRLVGALYDNWEIITVRLKASPV